MLKALHIKIAKSFGLEVQEDGMVTFSDGEPLKIMGKPLMIVTPKELEGYFVDGEYTIVPFNILKENKLRGVNPIIKTLLKFLDALQEQATRTAMRDSLIAIYEKKVVYDIELISLLDRLSNTSAKAKTVVDDETLNVFDALMEDSQPINKLSIRHNRKVNDVVQHTLIVNRDNQEHWEDKIKEASMRKRDERLFQKLFEEFTYDKVIAYARDDHSPDIIALLKALLTISDMNKKFASFGESIFPKPLIEWADVVDLNVYIKEANMLPTVASSEDTKATSKSKAKLEVTDDTLSLSELMKQKETQRYGQPAQTMNQAPALTPLGASTDIDKELRLRELEIEKLKLERSLPTNTPQTTLQPMGGGLRPMSDPNCAPWEQQNLMPQTNEVVLPY